MNEEIVFIYNVSRPLEKNEMRQTLDDALALMRLLSEKITVIAPIYVKNLAGVLDVLKNSGVGLPKYLAFQTDVGCFSFAFEQGCFVEKIYLRGDAFRASSVLLENYCDQLQKNVGLYGFIRSYREYLQNNESAIAKRTFNTAGEINNLPKMKDKEQHSIIDCQKLPGYNHYYRGLLFTSCWVTYISQPYFDFLPRNIFLKAQQVEKISYYHQSPQKTLKTKLFKDIFNWAHPANLKFAKMYQEQLGIYHLGSNNGVGVLVEPMTEYQFFAEGMQSMQYFNAYLQPTYKSQAVHFLSREMNYETKKEKVMRKKGHLNVRAFFPYVNEQSRQLLAYRVLYPERTIDGGASAYLYYIKKYLEVEIVEEDYQNFLPVLVFYIPKTALGLLPLDHIEAELGQVKIKKIRAVLRQTPTLTYDLTHNERKLRIVFANQEQLASSNASPEKMFV